jgi:hypothetical protein
VINGRARSPTDRSLVVLSLSLALWAGFDWAFLNTDDVAHALVLYKLRASFATVAILFILFFGRWLASRRSPWDPLLAGPLGAAVALHLTFGTKGIQTTPGGFEPILEGPFYWTWMVHTVAYSVVGLGYLALATRGLRRGRSRDEWRVRVLVWSFLSLLILWGVAKAIESREGAPPLPPTSAMAIVPALAILLLVTPVPRQRIASFFRALAQRQGIPRAAYLLDASGTVTATSGLGAEAVGANTSLADSLKVIDSVLAQAFHSLAPGGVKTISHGDTTFLIEKGSRFTLVLVIEGRIHDYMRSDVKDALKRFEEAPPGGPSPELASRLLTALLRPLEVF